MSWLTWGVVVLAAVAVSGSGLRDQDVQYHLFTRTNPLQSEPLLPNPNSIMISSFSVNRPTCITIHGNGEGVGGNFNAFTIPAHLSAEDVNLIAIDWAAGSSMYTQGLANAPQAGQFVAEFINILIDSFGYNPELIRIIGHGLGGHIAGIAARRVRGEIPHVIALDPSLVGWTHHPDLLHPDDATVVEVLHTTAGILGYDHPLGDIDFYPNGGTHQNGCSNVVSCSHTYAYAFYAESITQTVNGGNRFVGTECENGYEEAITMSCSGEQDAVFGGLDDKSENSGVYSFLTNFVPPFARG